MLADLLHRGLQGEHPRLGIPLQPGRSVVPVGKVDDLPRPGIQAHGQAQLFVVIDAEIQVGEPGLEVDAAVQAAEECEGIVFTGGCAAFCSGLLQGQKSVQRCGARGGVIDVRHRDHDGLLHVEPRLVRGSHQEAAVAHVGGACGAAQRACFGIQLDPFGKLITAFADLQREGELLVGIDQKIGIAECSGWNPVSEAFSLAECRRLESHIPQHRPVIHVLNGEAQGLKR